MGKFDGLEIEVDKPERMPVLHPGTRQPIVNRDDPQEHAYIDLYSGDSEVRRKHDRTIQKRRLSARNRRPMTPEEIEGDVVDLLAAMTAGWRLFSLDGALLDVPCTADNARELYASTKMAWLREQVDEWTADRGNFLKASSAT